MHHGNAELDYAFLLFFLVVAVPFAIWFGWRVQRSTGAERLLRDHGLCLDDKGRAYIEVDGTRVKVHIERDKRGRTQHLHLSLPRRDRPFRLSRGVARRDVAIGDPYFDEVVVLETSEPASALSFLGREARRVIVRAVRLGATFDGTRWTASAGAVVEAGADKLLPALVAAHRVLAEPTPLADIARDDPNAKVRLTALRQLDAPPQALLQALQSDLDQRCASKPPSAGGPRAVLVSLA